MERKSEVKTSEKMEMDAIWEDFMEYMKSERGPAGWVEFRQDGEKSSTEPNAQYRKLIHSSTKTKK